jgi:hypothetical protein
MISWTSKVFRLKSLCVSFTLHLGTWLLGVEVEKSQCALYIGPLCIDSWLEVRRFYAQDLANEVNYGVVTVAHVKDGMLIIDDMIADPQPGAKSFEKLAEYGARLRQAAYFSGIPIDASSAARGSGEGIVSPEPQNFDI